MPIHTLATLLLISLLLPSAPTLARQGPMLTPQQITSDVALAREAYERIHPGYTRYADAVSLQAAWQEIIDDARAAGGLSTGDFYLAVQRVLVKIRCDHTKAELPAELARRRRETPT